MSKDFSKLANKDEIDKTITGLKANGIDAEFVETAADAKKRVLELIPQGAEVMNMTSVTLNTTGIAEEINKPGKYDSVRHKLEGMDRATQGLDMQKLGVAPQWTVGSVHAVTQDGKVIIASNTGSQLPAYAYGAGHVIWVVGAQKVVKDLSEAFKRIYEYVLPLESERANKAYNITTGSFVSKLLIINREIQLNRMHVILVNEPLGF